MRTVALLVLVLALAAAGCGGDDEPAATTVTNPVASTPDATAPPADATQPGTTATTPPPTATQTPTQPSGGAAPDDGGGEQAVRVPASFVVVAGGRLKPPQITVPPFLAVEVSVRADDGAAHRLELRTPRPHVLEVAAGERAAVRIPGLRAGTYPVLLDGREAGAIIAGGEVGP